MIEATVVLIALFYPGDYFWFGIAFFIPYGECDLDTIQEDLAETCILQ
ncbi:hypothetical protein [Acidithiobacillus thiooxidans]|nr:hypothetical protein [Acidithiobacillus thiooxidans]